MARRWSRVEEDRVASLVDLCAGSTRQLKQVQAHVVANGQSQNNFLAAKLVRAFAERGILEQARAIANEMCNPNVFVWTALIRGYAFHPEIDNSGSQEALLLYQRLHHSWAGIRPLSFTLSSVLKACSQLQAFAEGRQVHAHVFKHGFQIDGRVQTTLINFYGECDHLEDARKVFEKISSMGKLDMQAWNTMVGKYAEAGDVEAARDLFDMMPERNTHTYIAMITGYATMGKMELARKLLDAHFPLDEKSSVAYTAMITGYARCGDLHAAREMFDELKNRDVASWNAMIAGYAQAGVAEEAVALFRLMLEAECLPNQTTIATVASSCAQSGCPSLANLLQAYVDGHPTKLLNSHTVASLIDLHSKCGDLHKAYDLFCKWKHRDLVCYSSMIAGFGIHGRGGDAISVFNELQESNLKPDAICFVSLLASCSHSGMVEEGKQYFKLMRTEYHISPTTEHYMCLVDLLGRAGLVEEAYRLITEEVPAGMKLQAGVWGALLSACRSYCNVDIGEAAARRLMEMEPENAGNYVLLSNIYAKGQRWGDVARVRAAMRSRGVRKLPGWSSVDVEGGGTRKFMTGEANEQELENVLQTLSWELKDQGYLPTMEEGEE